MKTSLFLLTLFALPAVVGGGVGVAHASASVVVPWFEGTVEAAFAAGKEQNRPLFLYWGAAWCPPCNQIKATIFSRREFAEKMKLFVPVYLDGDTDRAQIWGEKLKTSGYPTMIILSPAGEEVTRLPMGLQLEAFLETLDEALHAMTPMRTVLEQAMAAKSGDQVRDATWRLLAYYSWGQDALVKMSDVELAPAFEKLHVMVPDRLPEARSRLFSLWLQSLLPTLGEKDGKTLTTDQRSMIDRGLNTLLTSRPLTVANLEFLSLSAGDIMKKIYTTAGPDRTRLMTAWESAMEGIQADPTLSVDERITAVLPQIEFHHISHGGAATPALVQDKVRKLARWADDAATDDYTRQSALNTAGQLLQEVGLPNEARDLYLRQLEKAPSPYYFMSSLASLAKKAGDKEEAMEWLKKAYDTSKGRATRFQWGTGYLLGLLDLAPKDDARITAESLRVLTEVMSFDDAFAGRNSARVDRLKAAYAKWAGKTATHKKTLQKLSAELSPRCSAMSEESVTDGSQRQRCQEFFGSLAQS